MYKLKVLVLLVAVIFASCSRLRGREETVDVLLEMEGSPYQDREVSERRVEEIKQAIARYQKAVSKTVDDTGQIGIYYKMLALEYMNLSMFRTAYDALQEALAIHPENPILFYYSAICAARVSKAQVEAAVRTEWLGRSESLYLRAIDIDPRYADALYGISVLYVFELGRPAAGRLLPLLDARLRLVQAVYRREFQRHATRLRVAQADEGVGVLGINYEDTFEVLLRLRESVCLYKLISLL